MVSSSLSIQTGPRWAIFPRDIPSITGLMELGFAGALDLPSQEMLRQVRWLATCGEGIWNLSRILGMINPDEWMGGVVWVEEGKVVANATLSLRKPEPENWLLSNVAVHPEFRRRGIARSLVRYAFDQIHSAGGRRIYLQVDDENKSATHIYRELGCTEIGRRVTWICPPGRISPRILRQEEGEMRAIALRNNQDWGEEFAFFQEISPEGLAWNLPLNSRQIRPSIWRNINQALAGETENHFLARCNHRLAAVLMSRDRLNVWEGMLCQRPEIEEGLLASLLWMGLPDVLSNKRCVLETMTDSLPESCAEWGFQKRRTLIWMRQDLDVRKKQQEIVEDGPGAE